MKRKKVEKKVEKMPPDSFYPFEDIEHKFNSDIDLELLIKVAKEVIGKYEGHK